jgi:hypothetical protein
VEENRVKHDRSVFYVRWAQAFVQFLPEKRLRDRSRQDIEAFLTDLSERFGITDWQVKQAEHALKLSYEVFLSYCVPERTTKPIQEAEEERPAKGLDPGAGLSGIGCFPTKWSGTFLA